MSEDTIFGKIIRHEIPADIVYEDELCLAFRDVAPQAPMHILLIPKEPIAQLNLAQSDHQQLLGHLLLTAPKIAAQEGYEDAFRLVNNCGEKAGQSVFHLHFHIIGGRDLSWPPG
ncbi:MAG: histidine triad nucleotide-binding protein [Gammaproteobacteria bacterium]|nr:histidine triad nucleotide-binding protein [Gammaproteobacteria bacterium]